MRLASLGAHGRRHGGKTRGGGGRVRLGVDAQDAQPGSGDRLKDVLPCPRHQRVLAVAEEGEVPLSEPPHQVGSFGYVNRINADRRRYREVGRDRKGLTAHSSPVLDRVAHIVEHPMQVVLRHGFGWCDQVRKQLDAHPRLCEGAGGRGLVNIEVEYLDQLTTRITLHGKLRVHHSMNRPAFTREFIGDGVDQEWHVISHDADHGSGILGRRENANQGLA